MTPNEKETPAQVFSCEYYEIFNNGFLIEHLWWLFLTVVNTVPSLSFGASRVLHVTGIAFYSTHIRAMFRFHTP